MRNMMHAKANLPIMRVHWASKSVKHMGMTSNSLQKKLLSLEYESVDSRR